MENEITVRFANPADVPLILHFLRQLALYEKLEHAVEATEDRLRGTLFGPQPLAEVLIAHCDGECAGFALFFTNYSTFLAAPGMYLEDLFVDPQFRAKGIGVRLLRRLAEIALQRGCKRMDWEVLNWNEPAIRFYRKLGAVPLSDWTRYRLPLSGMEKLGGE